MGNDLCDRITLIRSIQKLEGDVQCYATAPELCGRQDCCWRTYCLAESPPETMRPGGPYLPAK